MKPNPLKFCPTLICFLLGIIYCQTLLASDEILIAYAGKTNTEAHKGVELGIEEANTQGKFLGLSFRLVENPSPLQSRVLGGFKAIVSDGDIGILRRLSSEYPSLPLFNLSERSETIRRECYDNLLHVIASEEMLDDAIVRWRRMTPSSKQSAIGWHHGLKKYAAAQLNKRYQERFGEPMSEIAWAGWASIKIVSDTIVRLSPTADLLYAIKNDLNFDGQKGVGLSFRETGQLRQPVLIIDDDKVIGEIPVPGPDSKNKLDDLGTVDCYK